MKPFQTPFRTHSIDVRYGAYHGTKTNSDYFWHYLHQLYEWREAKGLLPNIQKMDYIISQVAHGDRLAAVAEIIKSKAYEWIGSFADENYNWSVLKYPLDPMVPEIVVREPKSPHFYDTFYYLNQCAPGRRGSAARFVGEAYRVQDLDAVVAAQREAGTDFMTATILGSADEGVRYIDTVPSCYTQNAIRYVQYFGERRIGGRGNSVISEPREFLELLAQIHEQKQAARIHDLLGPLDHIATRVMHQDRENAILEIVKLTHHYPWGAYNIEEMNSSTNPTRNVYHLPEKHSPAKVFTAGNVAYFLSFLEGTQNPTDSFAYNFGRSMHHLAFDVIDRSDGVNYIDRVVEYVQANGVQFLGSLYGDRAEGIRQIFSERSPTLGWITEYVQRFDGFDGFFTRTNVAKLTEAAGKDELLLK